MVLDDIISSFDASHRKRFADLLIEEYGDYQIILLTHENTWFDIIKNLVRSKNWNIKTIKYNEAKGTHLEEIKKEKKELIESNTTIQQQIAATIGPLQSLLDDKQIDEKGNAIHKTNIEVVVKAIKKYHEQLKTKVAGESKLEDENMLLVDRKVIETVQNDYKTQLETIKKARKKDPKWDAHGKINIAAYAYAEIMRLRKEKVTYEKQRDTMETVYHRFLKKQKEALETFLDTFSERIDAIYQFLNPGEKVENIKLVPIEKDDELSGITIQFDFLNSK